jgi:predicted DNA-binding transcriptional regulator AlpA
MYTDDEVLDVEQVAELLGVTANWLYQMRCANRGPVSSRRGMRLRYRRRDVEEYLEIEAAKTRRGGGV